MPVSFTEFTSGLIAPPDARLLSISCVNCFLRAGPSTCEVSYCSIRKCLTISETLRHLPDLASSKALWRVVFLASMLAKDEKNHLVPWTYQCLVTGRPLGLVATSIKLKSCFLRAGPSRCEISYFSAWSLKAISRMDRQLPERASSKALSTAVFRWFILQDPCALLIH
jgi:hypothetical protein